MDNEHVQKLRIRFFAIYNKLPLCQTDIMHEINLSRTTLYRFMYCVEKVFSKKALSKILIWVESYECKVSKQ